jgi:DNA-binding NtrC family response regulator
MKRTILVVDDEKIKRVTMKVQLANAGYDVQMAEDAENALQVLQLTPVDIVITDIRMPNISGLDLLKTIRERYPHVTVILMTAYSSIETAVMAIKGGAYDYITKPFSDEELLLKLARLEQFLKQEEENRKLRTRLESQYRFGNIIGKSMSMRTIFEKIQMIADSNATVIIQGASGTGKELIASALHYNSLRKNQPFIKVSCGIFHQEILESELFGHEKGAFTGALRQKPGRFEMAHEGSIFLDDIDDISLTTQVKLLRILQEREFERVGGEKTIKVDVRVIAATKKDLKQLVEEGRFREDLYFRLKVIPLILPALSERREDIPLLVEHFVRKYSPPGKHLRVATEILTFASKYPWPGNIRELENAIEHATTFCQGEEITLAHFPEDLVRQRQYNDVVSFNLQNQDIVDINEMVRKAEITTLEWAWNKTGGHQCRMAQILNLPRTTLRDKLIRYKFLEE